MGKVHDYWKKINMVFAAACAVLLFISSHALAGIVGSGELTEPSFWILNNNAGDAVVLDEEGIKQFNRKICDASLDVTEMKSIPDSFTVKEFLPWISNTWAMRGTVYCKGRELTEAEKDAIQSNLNLAALPSESETVAVRYGVTVRHALVRNLPLAAGLFEEPDDVYYDNVQDSVLEAGEPVAILHESSDKKYYYVRMYNLFGWAVASVRRSAGFSCGYRQGLLYPREWGRCISFDGGQAAVFAGKEKTLAGAVAV